MAENAAPNILWIVSEDCPPRFGCYGDPLANTPHLDGLAERGVLFEHAYSAAPVCAPSRFAMLTGLAPESHAPADHMRANAALPSWLRTYPELLRERGYHCTNNVKTDYNCDADPGEIWAESSPQAHWRHRPEGAPFLAVFNFDGTHESAVFARRPPAVDPDAVRLPAYLPDTPEIRQDFARYYGNIAEMDAFVGQLLGQLAEDGLAEETVVIHTSDHGGVNPRSKRYCYDEGLHVPLIIAAPERFAHLFPPAGTRVEAAVSTIRIPPTLVDLAGGEAPEYMQGRSLARAAFDPGAELAYSMRNRMDERYDLIRTVRDARYRYLRNYHPHRPWGQHQGFAWLAAGYQSWEGEHRAGRLDAAQSAFWQPKPGVELYDTVADPDEVHNLAGDPAHAEVERRLATALRSHLIDIRDNGFLPEGSPHEGYDQGRAPDRYPLERIVDLADAVSDQEPANLPRFLADLRDPDSTVRRWAAIGVLALGSAAADAVDPLRATLDTETDPFVIVPCAEALARQGADRGAVRMLAELAGPEQIRSVRLEALGALTALDLAAVREFRDALVTAAEDEDQYVRSAGRYLLFRIDGVYTPRSPIFQWEKLEVPPEYAAKLPGPR